MTGAAFLTGFFGDESESESESLAFLTGATFLAGFFGDSSESESAFVTFFTGFLFTGLSDSESLSTCFFAGAFFLARFTDADDSQSRRVCGGEEGRTSRIHWLMRK